jgi:hypothetical protein
MAENRPLSVTIISVITELAGLLQVISGFLLIFAWEVNNVFQGTIDVAVGFLILIVGFLLLRGNRLARLVASVVLILSIVASLLTGFLVAPSWTWAGGLLAGLLALVALILLWTPRASRFFRRR